MSLFNDTVLGSVDGVPTKVAPDVILGLEASFFFLCLVVL